MIKKTLFLTLIVLFGASALFAQSKVTGTVLDDATGEALPFVSVAIVGTSVVAITSDQGIFSINVPSAESRLRFSFIGYETQEVQVLLEKEMLVRMKSSATAIQELVVTGIYTRRVESYTGAATTIGSAEIQRVGNQNVFQSLKNLAPSLYMQDNLAMGSNPNAIPSLQMRGVSSFPDDGLNTAIKGNYLKDPNQPLIILDGFEASVEYIMDLDMNRIESVTLLKDASAKALYGSKAANGVLVFETKRLTGNQLIVSYTGSLSIEAPDLTSYNLCNALEKLEVEKMEGIYTNSFFRPEDQARLDELYYRRLERALRGLDTYWLSKPLRLGVGHKHTLSVEVGDSKALRNMFTFSYNKVDGVMKGNDRTTISGSVSSSFRYKNVLFRNVMTLTTNNSNESPYGTFNDYVRMNPYWQAQDEQGNILRWAENSEDGLRIANPMYDATIGTVNKASHINMVNNFYAEWSPLDNLTVMARFGYSTKSSDADEFYPATHSKFVNYYSESLLRRGMYILDNGKGANISGDLSARYVKSIDQHHLMGTVNFIISEDSYSGYQFIAEGFPNNIAADITFARQYAQGSRPIGISSLNREISALAMFSYDYSNRYLVDLTFREGASSLYGKDSRWAPSWSTGIGWNIHNESFLKETSWLNRLKLRGSIGLTGNQNFNTNTAIGTYKYYIDQVYDNQLGAYLAQLANPLLQWEQKMDYNAGIDIDTKYFGLMFDYFTADSKNMLTTISIPTSTGFKSVKDNLGKVRNTGFEVNLRAKIIQTKDAFLSVNLLANHYTNTILSLSEAMREENKIKEQLAADRGNPAPVNLYKDGQALKTIWAVPSAGIDPTTGYEVYIKQDGSLTYTYDPADLIAAGIEDPKLFGSIRMDGEWKGFGVSATLYYRWGGDMYNQTLVDRVENINPIYNVDRRVLTGRWQAPGQIAQYKKLGSFQYPGDYAVYTEYTRATTRFVQERSELDIASISLYYEFPVKIAKQMGLERFRVSSFFLNAYKFSSIQIERGLFTPFSRTISLSLTATF